MEQKMFLKGGSQCIWSHPDYEKDDDNYDDKNNYDDVDGDDDEGIHENS